MSHPSANRVLVVDDSPDNRTLVAACLRDRHLTFEQAGDGRSAVRLALDTRPDLLIIDVDLPLLDGLGVIRSIRAHGLTPSELRVIALTGAIEADAFARCLSAGADDYLTKPLRHPQLLRAKAREQLLALTRWRAYEARMAPITRTA